MIITLMETTGGLKKFQTGQQRMQNIRIHPEHILNVTIKAVRLYQAMKLIDVVHKLWH